MCLSDYLTSTSLLLFGVRFVQSRVTFFEEQAETNGVGLQSCNYNTMYADERRPATMTTT